MKKLLSCTLSILLIASFAACSSADTGSSASADTESSMASSSSSEEITSDSNAQTSSESSAVEEPTSEFYFKDGVVQTEDLTITITDYKVIPVGEAGNEYGEAPVIAFWYDTTNKTGKEGINPLTAWMAVFTAVQDNDPNMVNELDVGMTPDEAALDTQTAEIKEGGTVSCAVAYVLDDETTPVTLTATKGIAGEELGTQDYPVQ